VTTGYQDPPSYDRFGRSVDEPRSGECLCCYVFRMLDEHGCDGGLLWSAVWRDHAVPERRSLERHLRNYGGYCDCEVLMNVHWLLEEPDADQALPPCRAGSSVEPQLACSLFS
jgi:hypothetical protein